jgi:thiamine pyrophosphokinase
MKHCIVTGPYDKGLIQLIDITKYDYIIGADSDALILSENKISFDLAVGDFDSVSSKEFDSIQTYAKEVHKVSSIKDITDTHLAVQMSLEKGADEVVIYGGLGKRIDHTLANITLLNLGPITIKNSSAKLYCLNPGTHSIHNSFNYISFFALEEVSELSLSGFKYPLDTDLLKVNNSLCISNEGEGKVSFKKGKLLVIHQNE